MHSNAHDLIPKNTINTISPLPHPTCLSLGNRQTAMTTVTATVTPPFSAGSSSCSDQFDGKKQLAGKSGRNRGNDSDNDKYDDDDDDDDYDNNDDNDDNNDEEHEDDAHEIENGMYQNIDVNKSKKKNYRQQYPHYLSGEYRYHTDPVLSQKYPTLDSAFADRSLCTNNSGSGSVSVPGSTSDCGSGCGSAVTKNSSRESSEHNRYHDFPVETPPTEKVSGGKSRSSGGRPVIFTTITGTSKSTPSTCSTSATKDHCMDSFRAVTVGARFTSGEDCYDLEPLDELPPSVYTLKEWTQPKQQRFDPFTHHSNFFVEDLIFRNEDHRMQDRDPNPQSQSGRTFPLGSYLDRDMNLQKDSDTVGPHFTITFNPEAQDHPLLPAKANKASCAHVQEQEQQVQQIKESQHVGEQSEVETTAPTEYSRADPTATNATSAVSQNRHSWFPEQHITGQFALDTCTTNHIGVDAATVNTTSVGSQNRRSWFPEQQITGQFESEAYITEKIGVDPAIILNAVTNPSQHRHQWFPEQIKPKIQGQINRQANAIGLATGISLTPIRAHKSNLQQLQQQLRRSDDASFYQAYECKYECDYDYENHTDEFRHDYYHHHHHHHQEVESLAFHSRIGFPKYGELVPDQQEPQLIVSRSAKCQTQNQPHTYQHSSGSHRQFPSMWHKPNHASDNPNRLPGKTNLKTQSRFMDSFKSGPEAHETECVESLMYLQVFFSKMNQSSKLNNHGATSKMKFNNIAPLEGISSPCLAAAAATAAANRQFHSSVKHEKSKISSLSRDQNGCRYIQSRLEENNPIFTNLIFQEVYSSFTDLMTDPFGNYLCQKLFEHCNNLQKNALIVKCSSKLIEICKDMHGTRAVQRLIECLSSDMQNQMVSDALAVSPKELMKDINGNHVIQKCLHKMEPQFSQFIFNDIKKHCVELATHRHGCCVIQRAAALARPNQKAMIAGEITKNVLCLVQDPFGNYVVQYVLGLSEPVYTQKIIRNLQGHLASLSVQKFSSNVIEKCLQQARSEVRDELIDELIENSFTIGQLLHDRYGNYVLQRVLLVAPRYKLESICEAIQPHLPSLKSSPYGKRIQSKILKLFPRGILLDC